MWSPCRSRSVPDLVLSNVSGTGNGRGGRRGPGLLDGHQRRHDRRHHELVGRRLALHFPLRGLGGDSACEPAGAPCAGELHGHADGESAGLPVRGAHLVFNADSGYSQAEVSEANNMQAVPIQVSARTWRWCRLCAGRGRGGRECPALLDGGQQRGGVADAVLAARGRMYSAADAEATKTSRESEHGVGREETISDHWPRAGTAPLLATVQESGTLSPTTTAAGALTDTSARSGAET